MATQSPEKTKVLRIRIVDHTKEGSPAVNIKVPMGLVKFGLKMAQKYSPDVKNADLDWDTISALIEQGDFGKIVEVEDEAQNKTVEIWVE